MEPIASESRRGRDLGDSGVSEDDEFAVAGALPSLLGIVIVVVGGGAGSVDEDSSFILLGAVNLSRDVEASSSRLLFGFEGGFISFVVIVVSVVDFVFAIVVVGKSEDVNVDENGG